MKKQLIILLAFLFLGTVTSFSQIETVPAEYIIKPVTESQTKKILEVEVRGFLEPIVNQGWEEGVAAIKSMIDPGQKKINEKYLKNEVYYKLRKDYHLAEFQDGDDLFLNVSAELGAGKGVLPIIPGRMATSDADIGPIFFMVFFELPQGKTIQSRGDFDPLKAYDLNPNDLSFISDKLPTAMIAKAKKDPSYLKRVFGITLIKKPGSKAAKVFVGSAPFKLIDGDFGPATGLKTTGDIQNKKGSKGEMTKVKNGQPMGVASEDELIAIKVTADKFLKAIRKNDASAMAALGGSNWSDATGHFDLMKQYRQLPEYKNADLTFVNGVVIDQNGCAIINWDEVGNVVADDVVINLKKAYAIVVYRLPKGMKASKLRAPTDIFNQVLFPSGDGWILAKNADQVLKTSGKGKWISLQNGNWMPWEFAQDIKHDASFGTIIGGPLIGTLIGKDNNHENYITVVLTKNPNSTNFNLGVILED